MNVVIKTGSIQDAYEASLLIPEFKNSYSFSVFTKRLLGRNHLILIAYYNTKVAGFKIGYHWEKDTASSTFYSWFGGILPLYRRQGIAKMLAEEQEGWARLNSYKKILFKTRNKNKEMLLFAIGFGFKICGFEERDTIEENRIWLEKVI